MSVDLCKETPDGGRRRRVLAIIIFCASQTSNTRLESHSETTAFHARPHLCENCHSLSPSDGSLKSHILNSIVR